MDTTLSNPTENIVSTMDINGTEVTIRPIQKNDNALEADFVVNLSTEAKHYRFMGGVAHLPDQAIENLCSVDYRNSMAFVAIVNEKESHREIGVVRYHKDNDGNKHQMAIAIADEYLDTELASGLMQKLIDYGRTHGVEHLYSVELYDNPLMKDVAESFSMSKKADPADAHQIIYSLQL